MKGRKRQKERKSQSQKEIEREREKERERMRESDKQRLKEIETDTKRLLLQGSLLTMTLTVVFSPMTEVSTPQSGPREVRSRQ